MSMSVNKEDISKKTRILLKVKLRVQTAVTLEIYQISSSCKVLLVTAV
uniref:Uncharacterized protein n=1 Tax=Arundo donax TaxID=35708 RepID=A0A0A9GZZ5_ARUDO